jgi:hypothetical protein
MLSNGKQRQWLSGADETIQRISARVNGPLGEGLIEATKFPDTSVMEVFRRDAPVAGTLSAPVGSLPKSFPEPVPVSDLAAKCAVRNRGLLESLKTDLHSSFLHSQVCEDAVVGRMTPPMMASKVDLNSVVLARRFSREQGTRADGTVKLRAVDDETASETNSTTQPTAKLKCDGADALSSLGVYFTRKTGEVPMFWKADIDKAYRRLPVKPEDRWLVWVAFTHDGRKWAAGHNTMPFGSVASVHEWDRVGAFLRHLGRTLLRIPLCRYVDDFFAADRDSDAEHALSCFVRVARALLGDDALADEKCECSRPLDVLGLTFNADKQGVTVTVNSAKAENWRADLAAALRANRLWAADAARMAGRSPSPPSTLFNGSDEQCSGPCSDRNTHSCQADA